MLEGAAAVPKEKLEATGCEGEIACKAPKGEGVVGTEPKGEDADCDGDGVEKNAEVIPGAGLES